MGIILSIPIGLIYNLIVSKIGNMLTKDTIYADKIRKNLIIEIIGGIVALALAFYVFGTEYFDNRIVKYGLIFGGFLLLVYSLIYNWDEIDDCIKLFLFLSAFTGTIIYSYRFIKNKNKNIKKNKKNDECDEIMP